MRNADTLAQMAALALRLSGRCLKYEDLIADNEATVGSMGMSKKKQEAPADPRFKGATPVKLARALRIPERKKPAPKETTNGQSEAVKEGI